MELRQWRLGNFLVHEEELNLVVKDVLGLWVLSVGKMSICGMNIIYLCNNDPQTADIYIKLLWAICNTIPDMPFIEDLWAAFNHRNERLPKDEDRGDEMEIDEIQGIEAILNMPMEQIDEELKRLDKEKRLHDSQEDGLEKEDKENLS